MRHQSRLFTALSVVLIAAGSVALIVERPWNMFEPERGVVFSFGDKSAFGKVRVVSDGDLRYLLVDGAIRAAVDTSLGLESAMPSTNVVDIAATLHHEPGKMLLIGLGGGSVAKHYARARWKVDAVENDPVIVEAAKRFFGFDSTEARLFREAPRKFIGGATESYDVIVVDACGSSSIPFDLLTREAFGIIASRLGPGGTLVVDVRAVGWHDRIVGSLAATLGAVFPNVRALPIAEPPDQLGNVILLASKSSLEIPGDLPVPTDRFSAEYDQFHAWENRFAPDTHGVSVVTDAQNPLERMFRAVNVRERKFAREVFARHRLTP